MQLRRTVGEDNIYSFMFITARNLIISAEHGIMNLISTDLRLVLGNEILYLVQSQVSHFLSVFKICV